MPITTRPDADMSYEVDCVTELPKKVSDKIRDSEVRHCLREGDER